MGRTIAAIAERLRATQQVLNVVGEAVGLVVEYLDREAGKLQDRRGGYFCWTLDTVGAQLVAHVQIGLVREEKIEKYRGFSLEKAQRLASRPSDSSSWQTRDEAHDQYGGAIRATGPILSFSGLPEHGDEAAMLLVAIRLGVLTFEQAETISRVSQNRTYSGIVGQLLKAGTWHDGIWTVPQE